MKGRILSAFPAAALLVAPGVYGRGGSGRGAVRLVISMRSSPSICRIRAPATYCAMRALLSYALVWSMLVKEAQSFILRISISPTQRKRRSVDARSGFLRAIRWAAMATCLPMLCFTYMENGFAEPRKALTSEQTPATIDGWRLLANRGVADAQFYLGTLYDLGLGGVRQDFVEAVKWYQLAAEQGDPRAQSSLAFFYIRGQGGVVRDLVQAHKWLSVSASRFARMQPRNMSGLGSKGGRALAAKTRDFIAVHMTRKQIAEAQRLAREWSPR